MVLNAQCGDNETARDQVDFVHHCYIDRSVTINPIVDWTEDDVWEYLKHYGCSANPLYQCGNHRIGCIGCPLSGPKNQKKDFAKYPKYKANYIAAFQRMVDERKKSHLASTTKWDTGQDVMRWWLGEDPNQLTMFDDDDIYEALENID